MPHGIMGNVAKHHGSKKKKKKKIMGWVPPPPVDRQIDGWMDGWMDGQTCVKTLPSRRTTYAGGNKVQVIIFKLNKKICTILCQDGRT